ncbi:diguanylate cyclase [Pseudomonas sp. LJDD11]|uniref:GGDEF domain-containing protein n=1 Tax=Pseudomonas sp. LJDD11 TaxID=2931984 RepID=UPI0027BACA54|nr:sensor domain-containing diguanylate cyclase [Pseudomonas sp. LJDD11]
MRIKASCLIMLIIFIAALFGIMARPLGTLSSLWPANAILAGLMVRNPQMARPQGWLGALVGFVAADVLTGSTLPTALLLTCANLVGAAIGCFYLSRLAKPHLSLQTTESVLHLILVSLAASVSAGLAGAAAMQYLFGQPFASGFYFWSLGEIVHYAIILPMVLAAPTPQQTRQWWRNFRQTASLPGLYRQSIPLLALVLSSAAALWIGGPGAVMFSVPALLWCALSYNLFGATVVTLIFSSWTTIAISQHYLDLSVTWPLAVADLQSIRIGILLLTLTPLTVAIISAARQQLLQQVQHLASHDQLSGLLNRRAFHDQATQCLQAQQRQSPLLAVLMLDIDRFKSINDTWGHSAGDQVLVNFTQVASECLGERGLFGRVGGEEFSILVPVSSADEAGQIAENIRQRFAHTPLDLGAGRLIEATVSIGVVTTQDAEPLKQLLLRADQALYQAKHQGRNRVQLAVPA